MGNSHNKNSKITNANNFVPWKHGLIVATELSRAQLCKMAREFLFVQFLWRTRERNQDFRSQTQFLKKAAKIVHTSQASHSLSRENQAKKVNDCNAYTVHYTLEIFKKAFKRINKNKHFDSIFAYYTELKCSYFQI